MENSYVDSHHNAKAPELEAANAVQDYLCLLLLGMHLIYNWTFFVDETFS